MPVLTGVLLAMALGFPQPPGAAGRSMKIVVVSGEGSLNNIARKAAQSPTVRVLDEYDAPLAGVDVRFELPESGPSGTFPHGVRECTVQTGPAGEATAGALRPNNVEGRFFIRVTAARDGASVTTKVAQQNTSAGGIQP